MNQELFIDPRLLLARFTRLFPKLNLGTPPGAKFHFATGSGCGQRRRSSHGPLGDAMRAAVQLPAQARAQVQLGHEDNKTVLTER